MIKLEIFTDSSNPETIALEVSLFLKELPITDDKF